MSKALISILGTNDYLECRHKFPDGEVSEIPVKYFQEDLLKKFCRDWNSEDEIRIFLTKDAKEKNWLDNGHRDKDGNPIPNIGLENKLKSLNFRCMIKSYSINEGLSEPEIWDIFQTIFDTFRNDEEIYVDITHSFRSLPLLMVTLLNFAKQVKNIRVVGIYYAAFDNLGPISKVKEIPAEERIAPVIDLTSFSELQDWTNATFDFINNANINLMKLLVKNTIQRNNTITQPIQKYFPSKVLEKLDKLINNIALCRGGELLKFNFKELKRDIGELKNKELSKAFMILVDEIDKKVSRFENDLENLIIELSEWCKQHKLFQQAITLLQEFTISYILSSLNLQINDETNRLLVTQAFRIRSQKILEEKWKEPAASNKDLMKRIINSCYLEKFYRTFDKITDIRNDVNHAGFLNKAKSFERINEQLEDIISDFKRVFGSYHANQSLQSSE